MSEERPVLLYDGDCRFCAFWVERWRRKVGDRMDFRTSQEAGGEFPQIPEEKFADAVQLVMDGKVYEGAEAVFVVLAQDCALGRLLLWKYRKVPGFAPLSRWGYRLVARNRSFFSWLTRLIFGKQVGSCKIR